MTELILELPHGYTLPTSLIRLGPNDLAACLDYLGNMLALVSNEKESNSPAVSEILKNIELKLAQQKENELQAERKSMAASHEYACSALRQENELTCTNLRHELTIQKQLNETMNAQLASINQLHEKELQDLKHENDLQNELNTTDIRQQLILQKQTIESLMTQNENRVNDMQRCYELQMTQAQNQITALYEQSQKAKDQTNTSQGQEGELQVTELVQKAISSSLVSWEDTTRVESAGDAKAVISRHDQHYTLLVEAKNVKSLHSRHDIEKFKHDVLTQKPDCAIMISLQKDSLNNNGSTYKREIIDGIPAITIQTSCEYTINLCIDYLIHQVQAKRAELKFQDTSHYSTHIDQLFTQILDHENSFNDRTENLDDARKGLDRDKKRMEAMKILINHFIHMYPVHTAKSTMDLALDEIKPGLTRKADYTSTEQIDLFNRAGGFDAVKREAKKRKLFEK